jgi:hypothetical protein
MCDVRRGKRGDLELSLPSMQIRYALPSSTQIYEIDLTSPIDQIPAIRRDRALALYLPRLISFTIRASPWPPIFFVHSHL